MVVEGQDLQKFQHKNAPNVQLMVLSKSTAIWGLNVICYLCFWKLFIIISFCLLKKFFFNLERKRSTFWTLGDKFHPQWKRALCSYVFLSITAFVLPNQPPSQLYDKNLLFKERQDSWDSHHASVYLLHYRGKNTDLSSFCCTSEGSQDSKTSFDDCKKNSYNVVCENRVHLIDLNITVTKTMTQLKRSLGISDKE